MAPYKANGSASPQERQHSLSPDPSAPGAVSGRNIAGPSSGPGARGGYRDDSGSGSGKRAKLTQSDFQRIQLEKLLANPDREVALPEPVREKTLRDPHEMMKNVQGSAAGAGSGEFHVYKASRRREYERVKLMEDKGRALEEQEAFHARQDERDAVTDAKTARNRAKRQKRKGGGKKGGDDDRANGPAKSQGGGGLKRKLAGGAEGFVVPKPGDDESGDEEEEVATSGVGIGNLNVPVPSENGAMGGSGEGVPPAVRRVEEPTVVIHDDD